jgi:L-fuconolactonase
MITDSHVHLWNNETEATPWRQGWKARAHGPGPFAAQEAMVAMDDAGVARAFAIPASWDVKGNELVLDCATRYPERFSAVCGVSLNRPQASEQLHTFVEAGAAAIRQVFPPGMASSWLTDGTADWLWPELEKAQVPLMLWAPRELEAIVDIASSFPKLRIAVDHMNLDVHSSLDRAFASVAELSRLSGYPNVFVKLSAIPCYASDSYPFRSVHELVRISVAEFGAERLIWGTDLSRLPCSYRDAVTSMTDHLPFLSADELDHIMSGSAARWLGGAS